MASQKLEKNYQELVYKNFIQNDNEQRVILKQLQQLLNYLSQATETKKPSAFDRLIPLFSSSNKKTPQSIYIYGDVGCGKSMLMDLFFEACPIQSKQRIHFHAFMQEVHAYIHQWRKKNEGDPVPSLALKIKNTSHLLCFDEFHVTDIADAMLLSRLFTQLFQQKIILVATSNQHPDDLYKNGLQRELFLPFIKLLNQSCEVIELGTQKDYRQAYFKSIKTTFSINSVRSKNNFLQQKFDELTNCAHMTSIDLMVNGRTISFSKSHADLLFTSFSELCGRPLGSADYLTIANEFKIILLADIPRLSTEIKDQARRFTTLIDTLYEKKVKLICTLDFPVEQLTLKNNDFDFSRTRSRLIEMQSEAYFYGKKNTR